MQFASATENMRRSTVREFLKFAKQPGMISFGGGLPAAELFPVAEFERASEAILRKHAGRALQYGETEGVAELRDYIATKYGVAVENVMITSGAQQALDLLGRVLIDRGDRIALENPTYLALLASWRVHRPEFVAIPSDENGMDVSQLGTGKKMLYVVPNFQNPQGTTLSHERRCALAEFAVRNEVVVVEDDPYGELRYEGEPLQSIFELGGKCNGPVVSVGTFSKVLSPGLRVGWVVAHQKLIEKLVLAKQSTDLHTSTFNQYVAWELATSGLLEHHVPRLRAEYERRRDAMLEALSTFMPAEVSWSRPAGGMFLLLRLPEELKGAEIARAALAAKVVVVPGEDFHIAGGENSLRLNFSNCAPELIRTGVERLANIVAQFVNNTAKYQVSFSSV